MKCFRKAQSRSFQLELHALMRVGVHPNVIRLFESYSKDEDALVLEYCDRSWAHEKLLYTDILHYILPPKSFR